LRATQLRRVSVSHPSGEPRQQARQRVPLWNHLAPQTAAAAEIVAFAR
jgi:hypothetical protein